MPLTLDRRSADLDNEVASLRRQLAEARNVNATTANITPAAQIDAWSVASPEETLLSHSRNHAAINSRRVASLPREATLLPTQPSATEQTELGADPHTPGFTTRPDVEEIQPRRLTSSSIPGPRCLGSTSLSVGAIADLYQR